ncbi:MAG: superoxide dismutase [Turicibacter sp.]|nr:superoxide dismutase [Turicibacter sp.]
MKKFLFIMSMMLLTVGFISGQRPSTLTAENQVQTVQFSQIPLPYAFDALEPVIDAKTMELHYNEHQGAAVTNLNHLIVGYESYFQGKSLEEVLKNIGNFPNSIRQGVINQGGNVANHDLFWTILTPGGTKPSPEFLKVINETFGSLDTLIEKINAAGLSQFGSGWAWLVVNGHGGLEVMSTPNQDSPLMQGYTPILGLDVWEHAYYLLHQNRRGEYLNNIWQIINWPEVERRFHEAKHS